MLTVIYSTGIAQGCEEKGKIKEEAFNQKVFITAVKNMSTYLAQCRPFLIYQSKSETSPNLSLLKILIPI